MMVSGPMTGARRQTPDQCHQQRRDSRSEAGAWPCRVAFSSTWKSLWAILGPVIEINWTVVPLGGPTSTSPAPEPPLPPADPSYVIQLQPSSPVPPLPSGPTGVVIQFPQDYFSKFAPDQHWWASFPWSAVAALVAVLAIVGSLVITRLQIRADRRLDNNDAQRKIVIEAEDARQEQYELINNLIAARKHEADCLQQARSQAALNDAAHSLQV